MNWLAHTLLSRKHVEYQLGNVLADPLRGRPWQGASAELINGMKMHKSIDKFTDSHPVLSLSKDRLGDDGHLKGVVLDLVFDHFLSSHWSSYAAIGLAEYLRRFNRKALTRVDTFPEKPQNITQRMIQTNLLSQYQTLEQLNISLIRIDMRLSERAKSKETASQYFNAIERNYQSLSTDFAEFFPDLIQHFKQHRLGSVEDSYLL